jgi:hypothetical protein
MRDSIQRILNALFEANNCSTPAEQVNYLRSLQQPTQALWGAFQQQTGIARDTQYTDAAIQAVYMLRYFPSYTQLVPACLSAAPPGNWLSADEPSVNAAYFGAGPAPEVYGTVEFLTRRGREQRLVANLFDINDTAWAASRSINLDRLIPTLCHPNQIEVHTWPFDLANQPIASCPGSDAIRHCHLVVFQNCLNEVPADRHGFVTDNLLAILGLMPARSLLLIIERTGYQAVERMIHNLANESMSRGLCDDVATNRATRYDAYCIKNAMPPIVTENLLLRYGDFTNPNERGRVLSPTVDYSWSAFRRVA